MEIRGVVLTPPSKWAVGHLRQGAALSVYMPAQSGQHASDSAQFPAFSQEAVLEDFVFHMVNQITLAGDDRRDNIGKVLDELDDEAQSACDGHSATKLEAESVDNFERMKAGRHDEIFIYKEVDFAETIGVSVEVKMQVPENPRKASLYVL